MSVESASRWGQIHALGGYERLVRAIVGTRLGRTFENDGFWVTAIGFLVDNPMLDPAHIGPIIDYLEYQKFTSQEVFVDRGVIENCTPPQPNLTMKGRTPDSLLRQVEASHHGLARSSQPPAEWSSSGIGQFELVEGSEQNGNMKVWTITELLSTKALVVEGRTMRHYVASYNRSCAHGTCSIWTMESETFEGRRKILTLEVDKTYKMIRQARGKYNAMPCDKHRQILRRWAEKAGLQLAGHV